MLCLYIIYNLCINKHTRTHTHILISFIEKPSKIHIESRSVANKTKIKRHKTIRTQYTYNVIICIIGRHVVVVYNVCSEICNQFLIRPSVVR